jgi:hypothetical protein
LPGPIAKVRKKKQNVPSIALEENFLFTKQDFQRKPTIRLSATPIPALFFLCHLKHLDILHALEFFGGLL